MMMTGVLGDDNDDDDDVDDLTKPEQKRKTQISIS